MRRLAGGQWSELAGPSDLPANVLTDLAHDGRALWLSSVLGLSLIHI